MHKCKCRVYRLWWECVRSNAEQLNWIKYDNLCMVYSNAVYCKYIYIYIYIYIYKGLLHNLFSCVLIQQNGVICTNYTKSGMGTKHLWTSTRTWVFTSQGFFSISVGQTSYTVLHNSALNRKYSWLFYAGKICWTYCTKETICGSLSHLAAVQSKGYAFVFIFIFLLMF